MLAVKSIVSKMLTKIIKGAILDYAEYVTVQRTLQRDIKTFQQCMQYM